MRLCRLLKLSHAEFLARRKVITLSVLAAGIPLAILLMINLIAAGTARIAMDYAGRPTDGAVYFLLTDNSGDPTRYVQENHGEVIQQITEEDLENYSTPLMMLADLAGLSPEQVELIPSSFSINYDLQNFNLANFFLDKIPAYQLPFDNDMDLLKMSLANAQIALVKFPDVKTAFSCSQELAQHHSNVSRSEVFSNLYNIYVNFRTENTSTKILSIAALVIAIIIIVATFVYLLDQNLHAMVVYRALGASSKDLLVISLGYLLEISLALLIYVVVLAIVGASIFSMINFNYVGEFFRQVYHVAQPEVWLVGWNQMVLWVSLAVLLSAPVSLLLMLDQFSVKRLSQRLKQV